MPSIIAESTGGGNFELAPSGNHTARCVRMIHIGTMNEQYLGETKILNKVRISWELPEEKREFKQGEGMQPFLVTKEFTLSMHEKSNLRKILESWRGKGFTEDEAKAFDITNLIGVPCLLNVIHKASKTSNNTYVDVSSISPLPKSMVCPDQINESLIFTVTEFDQKIFDSFPEWLQDKIKSSIEYQSLISPNEKTVSNDDDVDLKDDSLPF